MLWLFVYLTSLDLFGAVIAQSDIGLSGKLSFILGSVRNILTNLSDPRALSIFLFSLIATVNLMLMFRVISRKRKIKQSKLTAVGGVGAMIGSHCIACGGSFIAPLVTTIAGSGAYFSSARINTAITISVMINVIAMLVVGRTTLKLARQEKNILLMS
jgi:hypothetical protein